MRVAGYQMPVSNDIEANSRKIIEAIEWAAGERAEILLTPEGSLSGYTHEFDPRAVAEALIQVTARAKDYQIGLALGTCFLEDDGKKYNQVRFYRPDGEYLGFHSKILLCGSVSGGPDGEIHNFSSTDLKVFSWRDGIRIGGLICNDLWANPECTSMPDPHLSQRLAEMEAGIIFHAVNGGRNGSEWSRLTWGFHEANTRMRARAGKLWIVTADSSRPVHLPCSAPSGVISPNGIYKCRTAERGEQYYAYTIGSDTE